MTEDPFWQAYRDASTADQHLHDQKTGAVWDEDRKKRRELLAARRSELAPFRAVLDRARREAVHRRELELAEAKSELAAAQRKARAKIQAAKDLCSSTIGAAEREEAEKCQPVLGRFRPQLDKLGKDRDAAVAEIKRAFVEEQQRVRHSA